VACEGKYFSRKELECPCGCGECDMDDMFLERLDMLRYRYNRPIRLNSAYRCQEHNGSVGGVSDSAHTKGLAVDIKANTQEKYWLMKYAFELGFRGVGQGKSFIHFDDEMKEPRPNVWEYS